MSTTPTGDATVVDPDVAGAYATGTGITPMQRKVLLGGSVGQFIEFYDFSLYAISAVTLARLFFPAENETAALLALFAATLPEVPDPDRPVEPDLTGVRIGLCASIGSYPVAPRVRSHTIAFAGRLESLGARIVEVELPWEPDVVFGLMFAHFGHLLAPQMRRLTTGHEHELAAYTRRFLQDAFAAAQQRSFLDCTVLEAAMQA